MRRGFAKGWAHEIGEARRARKPWPPSITSVHTITRKGIGVSPRPCPVAAMANAAQAPIPSGSSNTHRLCTAAPTSKAIARIRMIVMRGRVTRTRTPVHLGVRAPKVDDPHPAHLRSQSTDAATVRFGRLASHARRTAHSRVPRMCLRRARHSVSHRRESRSVVSIRR